VHGRLVVVVVLVVHVVLASVRHVATVLSKQLACAEHGVQLPPLYVW
jgi:hypothetical protein